MSELKRILCRWVAHRDRWFNRDKAVNFSLSSSKDVEPQHLFTSIQEAQQVCVTHEEDCQGINGVFSRQHSTYIYEIAWKTRTASAQPREQEESENTEERVDRDPLSQLVPAGSFLSSDVVEDDVAQSTSATDDQDPMLLGLQTTDYSAHSFSFNCACAHSEPAVYADFIRYYKQGTPPVRLIVDLSHLLTEPNLSSHHCAAAVLSALLLKVEETVYYDRKGARRILDRYLVEFGRALRENRISEEEAREVWYLDKRFRELRPLVFPNLVAKELKDARELENEWRLMHRNAQIQEVVENSEQGGGVVPAGGEANSGPTPSPDDLHPKTAEEEELPAQEQEEPSQVEAVSGFSAATQEPSAAALVDFALSFCKEDLSWLEDLLYAEEAKFRGKGKVIRIFLYRKCLFRGMSEENQQVVRRINALLLDGVEVDSPPSRRQGKTTTRGPGGAASDYRILKDVPEDPTSDYSAANSNIVAKSGNVWNAAVALERNKNQDIMANGSNGQNNGADNHDVSDDQQINQNQGGFVEEDHTTPGQLRWNRISFKEFVGSCEDNSSSSTTRNSCEDHVEQNSQPSELPVPTSDFDFAENGVFRIADVVEDIRSDECSAYLTHLMLFSVHKSFAKSATFFLHADAVNHVLPSVQLLSQLLQAFTVEQSWNDFNAVRVVADKDFTAASSEIILEEAGEALPSDVLPAGRKNSHEANRNRDEQHRAFWQTKLVDVKPEHWIAVTTETQDFGSTAEDNQAVAADAISTVVEGGRSSGTRAHEDDTGLKTSPQLTIGAIVPVLYLTQNFISYIDSERLLEDGIWQRFFTQLFHSSVPPDENGLKFYCCAHFVAPTAALLRRSAAFYADFWRYMTSYESYTDMLSVSLEKRFWTTSSRNKMPSTTSRSSPAAKGTIKEALIFQNDETSGKASSAVPRPSASLRLRKDGEVAVPVATWYDRVCRYPCQHLMNFWPLMFGDDVSQTQRFYHPNLPYFVQIRGIDMKAYYRYLERNAHGVVSTSSSAQQE
ncbi:unnamed protein product [Amoebophrya sp. A120]|nr:unnamed protein product [Amoebophrya sp. A120]|eukprot:GSA120T00008095001.1